MTKLRWLAVFVFLWLVIIGISGTVLFFASSNDPFITNHYQYKVTLPIFFYQTGEVATVPSVSIWATFTTTNTVGNEFIAGDEIDVSAVMVVGNVTNPFQYNGIPTYSLGFQNALIWNQTRTLNAVTQNFTINVPALMPFSAVAGNVYSAPTTPFYWPTGGNYAPILYITNPTTDIPSVIPQNFTNFSIDIQPQSVLTANGYNRVNEALTYALVFFGVVEIAVTSRIVYRKAFTPSDSNSTDE